MLSKKEFAHYFLMKAREYASHQFTVQEQKILKNNGTWTSISFAQNSAGILIYPDQYYESYLNGMDKDVLVKEAIQMVIQESLDQKQQEILSAITSDIQDYGCVQDKIFPRLINYDKNFAALKNMPYERFLDLAVVCSVSYEHYEMKVNNDLMKIWGTSKEEIFKQAWKNYRQKTPTVRCDMQQLLREMGQDHEYNNEFRLEVLTTKDHSYGAVAMTDEKLLKEIYQENGDYYILPSSIHEVLILHNKNITPAELEYMVRNINRTEVEPFEVLSDHVYQYLDGKIKVFENGKEIIPEQTQKDINNRSPKL